MVEMASTGLGRVDIARSLAADQREANGKFSAYYYNLLH